MTIDLDAIRARNEKAHEMVVALCKPRGTDGARDWTMSIPARPDHDPDLVISDALRDGREMAKEIERLRGQVEVLEQVTCTGLSVVESMRAHVWSSSADAWADKANSALRGEEVDDGTD